jgi:hypothetical protein
MTLIALVSPLERPFLISDVLASAEQVEHGSAGFTLPGGTDIPHGQLEHLTLKPAGFVRKIVEIQPRLVAAWAGDFDQAREFAASMRFYFRYTEVSKSTIQTFLAANGTSYPKVQAIILAEIGDYFSPFPFNIAKIGPSPGYGTYAAGGSGAHHFERLMKNPYSPVKGDGLDDDDPLGRVLHLCHRFYSDELAGSLPTIKANYGGAIEVYEGTEKVENIMHLIMVSEFEDGVLKDFGMHPRVFRTGYYGPHFLTMSMPLENSDLPAIRMLIPDLLQGIPEDLSKIEPPPLPPHVLCIQHEISTGDHKFAILQTAHGKAYVENLIQFEDDGEMIHLKFTELLRHHIAAFGKHIPSKEWVATARLPYD